VDTIEELLHSLAQSLASLRVIQTEGVPDPGLDPVRWAGVRYLAQTAIQACVDIADQVLAWENVDEPPRSRDVFPALAAASRLDPALAQRLSGLVGLRNSLVHNYAHVSREEMVQKLPEVIGAAGEFAEAAARWLARA